LAARLLPAEREVPPYVAFGEMRNGTAGLAGYLGTTYNPFIVEGAGGKGGKAPPPKGGQQVRGVVLPSGFTLEELENRVQLLQGFDRGLKALDQSSPLADGLDAFHKKALEILRSDKTKKAFDLAAETQATREHYGPSGFGQGVLAARRLVEAGV